MVVGTALGTVALTAANAWKPESFWIQFAKGQSYSYLFLSLKAAAEQFKDWEFKQHLLAQRKGGLGGRLHLDTLQGVYKTGVMTVVQIFMGIEVSLPFRFIGDRFWPTWHFSTLGRLDQQKAQAFQGFLKYLWMHRPSKQLWKHLAG